MFFADRAAPALHSPASGGGHPAPTCPPSTCPSAGRLNHRPSVPPTGCTLWFLMILAQGFLCQIHTGSSFLSFNIINHPTFSISELRNLHFYNGGFEKEDINANVPQTV